MMHSSGDSFLIERTISLNVFGAPLSSFESHINPAKNSERQHHSSGIWLKASYINHSCFSNVQRSFIGDFQLVRATRDLPLDTELGFAYQSPKCENYQETQKRLQNWGFECDCSMCLDAKNTPKKLLKKREALLGDLKTTFSSPGGHDPAKAERLLAALERTYSSPPTKAPRLALWTQYMKLTRIHASQSQPAKVISTALKALQALGFIIKGGTLEPGSPNPPLEVSEWGLMTDNVVEAWAHLWIAYAAVAPHLCQRAEEFAKTSYRIVVGEDFTFDKTYGAKAREAIYP